MNIMQTASNELGDAFIDAFARLRQYDERLAINEIKLAAARAETRMIKEKINELERNKLSWKQ